MATSEKNRAAWSKGTRRIFIDLCIEQIKLGGKPSSNLKPKAWKKVVEAFVKNTGLNYDQRQLKNQWDLMKRQYLAWSKLLQQTGIGYNAHTHIIQMEDERWVEYLKNNPDAKIFRSQTLEFAEDMEILFGGTTATGKAAWTPGRNSFPDDMLRTSHDSVDLTVDSETSPIVPSTPVDVQQEIEDDTGLEEQLNDVRRKRPCLPPRKRKRTDEIRSDINAVIQALQSPHVMPEGHSIAECIASLKQIPEIEVGSRLYVFALKAFRMKENREVWMSEDSTSVRIEYLKLLMED
ncbi:hypothetical protein HHK36_013469 [Tetracentron sinense]|uniref:Myb/SANT-like domain-containing protein n=1 Tax=Tetracentron sinense TaxID=13715 RepID=A0A835DDD1_TETSI|nr:hypothetical protein HHK36_013469 [Tetracentron sinense]